MATRNTREGAVSTGITPQIHGTAAADKLNRETAGEIGDLKKGLQAVTAAAPGEGEAPADTPLFALRAVGHGWPFVTATVSVPGPSAGVDVPGTGFGLGTLYKGERIVFQFDVDRVTSSGTTLFRLTLLGRAGQGSPEAVVAEATPYLQNPFPSPAPVYSGAGFTLDRQILEARIRVRLASDGGSASIPVNSSMLQYFQVYTPIRRPAAE